MRSRPQLCVADDDAAGAGATPVARRRAAALRGVAAASVAIAMLMSPIGAAAENLRGDGPAVAVPSFVTVTADPQSTWRLSDAQRQSIRELMDDAIARGFPDGQNLTIRIADHALPYRATRFDYAGPSLFFRGADGTWIDVAPPYLERVMQVTGRDVEPMRLNEVLRAGRRRAVTGAITLRARYDNEQLERLKTIVPVYDVLSSLPPTPSDSGVLYLMRAGAVDEETATTWLAYRRDEDQADHWSVGPSAWSLDRALVASEPSRAAVFPDPVVSVRRALHRWFCTRFEAEAPTPADIARWSQAALSVLDDADRAVRAPVVAMLADSAALPIETDPGAPVAERLRAWRNLYDAEPFLDGLDPSTQVASKCPAGLADLRGIVAALDDDRTARFIGPLGTPATVGEVALYALQGNLGFDPRAVVGRDLDAPWTKEERASTATALQAWFGQRNGQGIESLLLDAMPRLSIPAVYGVLRRADPTSRPRLLARLAALWAAGAPVGDTTTLACIMAEGLGNAAFAAAADEWPSGGDRDLLMAVWHERRGRHEPLDAQVRLVERPEVGRDQPTPRETVAAILSFLTTERAARLQAIIARDPGSPALIAVLENMGQPWGLPCEAAPLFADEAAVSAAMCTLVMPLLADGREAPASLLRFCDALGIPESAGSGWRVCDIVASVACRPNALPFWWANWMDPRDLACPTFSAGVPPAERDRCIGELRVILKAAEVELRRGKGVDAQPKAESSGF